MAYGVESDEEIYAVIDKFLLKLIVYFTKKLVETIPIKHIIVIII